METLFTGHMYTGFSGETCNSCGNCDGGSCETCEQVWLVNGQRYTNQADAIAAEHKEVAVNASLLGIDMDRLYNAAAPDYDPKNRGGDIEYGELETERITFYVRQVRMSGGIASYGLFAEVDLDCITNSIKHQFPNSTYFPGRITLVCNIHAEGYCEKYGEVMALHQAYMSCPVVDKADESCGENFTCDDRRCLHEVNHCGRKEKKWYM